MEANTFFAKREALRKAISSSKEKRIVLLSIRQYLDDADILRDFFRLLDSPDWIAVLYKQGFFRNPPKVEQSKGGGFRVPNWPASQYLARMAERAPDLVAEVFRAMPLTNQTVASDLLDAALKMPSNVGATLVPKIREFLEGDWFWFDFKDASHLCVKLAEGEQADAALELAAALFAPRLPEGKDSPRQREEYWYKEGLEEVLPVLVSQRPSQFLPMLCDWLKQCIEVKSYLNRQSGDDGSPHWRPAIEEHEQNKRYDFAGEVAGFVREGFELAINNGGVSYPEALRILEEYTYLIFKRLRVHLITEFAELNPPLVRETIRDRGLFADPHFKHEYSRLVRQHFELLLPEQQSEWLAWVDAGPGAIDPDYFDEQDDQEKREAWTAWWKFYRLHWVRKHLEGERKTFFERMLEEHGEQELSEFVAVSHVGWRGQESPYSVEELEALIFSEAVEKVSSWRPEKVYFDGPDMTGLASTFGEYVAKKPAEYSKQAGYLRGKHSIVVRAFIEKMEIAVKESKEIDLFPVIDLCQWAIEQPVDVRTTPEQAGEGIVDKDWQWTRDSVAGFVESVCKRRTEDKRPYYPMADLQRPLWNLIEPLTRAESSKPSEVIRSSEELDDPRLRDYLNVGINSSRGKAVEAALEYASWVGNHLKQTVDGKEVIESGIASMPEVRGVLEWQVAPENRDPGALAIIGSRARLFYWIDSEWLKDYADRLFLLNSAEAEGWAAWNGFLVWVQPHIEFLRLFRKQFEQTVRAAKDVEVTQQNREQPMLRFGVHLVILYGRGEIGLEPGSLFRQFLENAKPAIRSYAIEFVGDSLDRDEKLPPEVIQRFMQLWDWYWERYGPSDVANDPSSGMFGRWFASGQFPPDWSLSRLNAFVHVVPTPEPDSLIMEHLAGIAGEDVKLAVNILEELVQGDKEGWRVYGWRDDAKKILDLAMKSDVVRVAAEHLINELGRRGYVEFGELLKRA